MTSANFIKTDIPAARAKELFEEVRNCAAGGVVWCDTQDEMNFLDQIFASPAGAVFIVGAGFGERSVNGG